jgi:serine/threonine-protein kinase
MGVVFLARDVALDRLVAIKLLPPVLAARSDFRDRFLREARTAARLSHPHIVPIYSVEEHQDLVFFAMGYVDGESAGDRVRRLGPLTNDEVARIIQEVAWALGHAHSHGIVHRDIKPDNILLERGTGRALVTDFGIAKAAAAADGASGGSGTPQYMAPEQAAGESVDGRADLYALGVTTFFLLTGQLPFQSDNAAGFLAKHAGEVPPRVQVLAPRSSPRLAGIIEQLMAKNPSGRFPTADAVVESVQAMRGARGTVPAPVRGFIRDVEGAGGEIGFLGAVAVGSLLVRAVFFAGDMFAPVVFYPIAILTLGLAGARFAQVFGRIRDLVRQGYSHAHLRPAIAADAQNRSEEGLAVAPRRAAWRETVAISLVGAVKTGLLGWVAQSDLPVGIAFLGAVGAILIPAIAVRRIWNLWRSGKKPVWLGLLGRKLGRWLFEAGGLGISTRQLPAASELTEVALGSELHQLFARLPNDLQRRFAELPDLVDRLQADGQLARMQEDGGGNVRLTDAVAALESIRLDLLRLHAGAAVQDELTRDLDAAQKLSDRIWAS